MSNAAAVSTPTIESLGLSQERRGFISEPPIPTGQISSSPPRSETIGAFPADNLPFPDSDSTMWNVTQAEGMTPGGRWHETMASHIHPTTEGNMEWEGETGSHTGIHRLINPDYLARETPILRVEGNVSWHASLDSIQVGGEEITPIIVPPILQGTEIIAARISSIPERNNSTAEVYSMDYDGTGVQQLAIPTSALQQIADVPTTMVHVEYWLSETLTAENPRATEPVVVSRAPIDQETQARIAEAWEDHLGEPLPADPSARISRQVEVLENLDQTLEPIPVDMDLEDPADIVVTILEQEATNDTASTTALVVSNPTLNVVNGYCNNTDGNSHELSAYEVCRWAVDRDGVIYQAGTVYDESADTSAVYEEHAATLREKEPGIVMVPVEEEKPDSVLPFDGVTGIILLAAGGLAALATRARSARRKHIHSASSENVEAVDPFNMPEVADDELNGAHQALMHHLWGNGSPPPTRESTLSRDEIVASIVDHTRNGDGESVLASLEAAPGFSDNSQLQLAHQIVSRMTSPAGVS
jgi:hypothetical protein